jgi:hypothetical protein
MTAEIGPVEMFVARLDLEWMVEQRFKLSSAQHALNILGRSIYPRTRYILILTELSCGESSVAKGD